MKIFNLAAESAVEHAYVACGSWHRTLPFVPRPRTGHTAQLAAMQPEFLAPKAAIPAVNRSAFPVNSLRMSV